jgi:hypothetical protein
MSYPTGSHCRRYGRQQSGFGYALFDTVFANGSTERQPYHRHKKWDILTSVKDIIDLYNLFKHYAKNIKF